VLNEPGERDAVRGGEVQRATPRVARDAKVRLNARLIYQLSLPITSHQRRKLWILLLRHGDGNKVIIQQYVTSSGIHYN
jgi:hypothetical protein